MSREREFTTSFSADFDTAYPDTTTGARPHFGFPFWLGSEADAVLVAPAVPDRWTTLGNETNGWATLGSSRHRFERIYTQPGNTFGSRINFDYQIGSQFPFFITSDAQVLITSTITNP